MLTQISEKQCRYQDFIQPMVTELQTLIYQAKRNRLPPVFKGVAQPKPQSKPEKGAGKGQEKAAEDKPKRKRAKKSADGEGQGT